MKFKKIVLVGCGVLVIATSYLGWQLTARGAYESAEYRVVESDGPFEVREYPELMLATTSMQFESQGNDGSFMRLFRYISGANDQEQKVAMTTPVFMDRQSPSSDGRMGFVMPKKVMEQGVPEPTGDGVQIRRRPTGRFAVVRFPGRINQKLVESEEKKLRQWMAQKGLTEEGQAELAGYDPPWTPAPLRRNELLIRLR